MRNMRGIISQTHTNGYLTHERGCAGAAEAAGTSKTAIDVCLGEVEAALKGALKIKDRLGPVQVLDSQGISPPGSTPRGWPGHGCSGHLRLLPAINLPAGGLHAAWVWPCSRSSRGSCKACTCQQLCKHAPGYSMCTFQAT